MTSYWQKKRASETTAFKTTFNLSKISHLKVVIRTASMTNFDKKKTCFQGCQRQKSLSIDTLKYWSLSCQFRCHKKVVTWQLLWQSWKFCSCFFFQNYHPELIIFYRHKLNIKDMFPLFNYMLKNQNSFSKDAKKISHPLWT